MLSSHSFSEQKQAAGSAEIRGYEKIQEAHSPPLLFRGGGTTGQSLQPAPDFSSKLLPFSAPLWSDTATAQSSVAAQHWPRPHQQRRGRGTGCWLVKPLSISPSQQHLGFHYTRPSGSPACPHPPAYLQQTDERYQQREGKVLGPAQRGLTSGRWCKKTCDLLRQMLRWWSWSYSAPQLVLQHALH